MSLPTILGPDGDDACCSCPETPCAPCGGCDELPEFLTVVLSGFSPVDGCIDAGDGLYFEVDGASVDGTYTLSGGGDSWNFSGTGDYVDATFFGTDSTCTDATGTGSSNGLNIGVSCGGGVLYFAMQYTGALNGGAFGSGGVGNPASISTTPEAGTVPAVASGAATISWPS